MGLFKFAKSIGAKIFGSSEAQAAPADAIKKAVADHGLDASGLKVEVNGDKVSITGSAASTEQPSGRETACPAGPRARSASRCRLPCSRRRRMVPYA